MRRKLGEANGNGQPKSINQRKCVFTMSIDPDVLTYFAQYGNRKRSERMNAVLRAHIEQQAVSTRR